jgi:DNA-binding LytR/AlgR family response regulator
MSQGEIPASLEPNEDDDSIAVWPWVDPKHSEANGANQNQAHELLAPSQVSWVQLNGHLMELHTATGEKYVRRGTLANLQRQWAKYGFVRIHREYLVSIAHIRKLRTTSTGRGEVCLNFGTEVIARPVSHRRLSQFKQMWTRHLEAQHEKSFIDLDEK